MPDSLIIELRPSRALLASVLVAHLAAALALLHVPALGIGSLDAAPQTPAAAALPIAVWGLLAASLLRALVVELGKRDMRLVFEDDGHVELSLPGRDAPVWCEVQLGSAVDLEWGIWVALAPVGGEPSRWSACRRRRLMLLRGNLDRSAEQSWRKLRVWLRHKSGQTSAAVPTRP